jgi:hypothetical protein
MRSHLHKRPHVRQRGWNEANGPICKAAEARLFGLHPLTTNHPTQHATVAQRHGAGVCPRTAELFGEGTDYTAAEVPVGLENLLVGDFAGPKPRR